MRIFLDPDNPFGPPLASFEDEKVESKDKYNYEFYVEDIIHADNIPLTIPVNSEISFDEIKECVKKFHSEEYFEKVRAMREESMRRNLEKYGKEDTLEQENFLRS